MHTVHPLLLHTKLVPPHTAPRLLPRKRLAKLANHTPRPSVLLIVADPGYGKSTVLTALLDAAQPTAWLSLEPEDASPLRFLTYLVHSFRRVSAEITDRAIALLEQPAPDTGAIIDSLLNGIVTRTEPIHLIIDDAQHLIGAERSLALLNRLIVYAPASLQIAIATRGALALPALRDLRLQHRFLTIDRSHLAFTPAEIAQLFRDVYNHPLSADEAAAIAQRTEGWPIVLPLIHRRLQQGETVTTALKGVSKANSNLFQFLTQQLLDQVSAETRRFLHTTAVLRHLDPAGCDAVRGATDSNIHLHLLRKNGLFVTILDHTRLRYHHLFRDLLYHQLPPTERTIAHERAGRFLAENGDPEAAIEHFVAAGNSAETARHLSQHGHTLIATGRLQTVAAWIADLPPGHLTEHPNLLLQLGDIARLQSRFESALGWYEQAATLYRNRNNRHAVGRALRGQARVYLDTVRPTQAENLLREALQLSDGTENRTERARLLDLLAENLLNQGRVEQAQTYRQQARHLRDEGPGTADLPVRLMLRTGRLHTARRTLETRATRERAEPILRPRSHRETLLLLSLIAAMQGDSETAMRCAVEGTERARRFDSPFTLSVGYMRQGAAWLLQKDEAGFAAAHRCFQQAIDTSQRLDLPRLRVEALWGMTQIHGFQGRMEEAIDSAETAIEIAHKEGDEWIATCIELTLGAAFVLADNADRARTTLNTAIRHAADCADPHLTAVARLWQCLLWQRQTDTIRLERDLAELLPLIATHRYHALFLKRTLLSPPDPRCLVPLLIFARDHNIERAVAEELLQQLGLAAVERHPGYQLRVATLGSFTVRRGLAEPVAWQRHKARELFLLLLTERPRSIHREQIIDSLWPDLTADEAAGHFKTAYNALCKVLEPHRKRNQPSAFVLRNGSRYGLRPEADVWIDSAEFDTLITTADHQSQTDPVNATSQYKAALALYKGAYLQPFPFLPFTDREQRRLHNRYLRAAERLAYLHLTAGNYEQVIDLARAMLTHDNCWEPAYRLLIIAWDRAGNRPAALRAYRECERVLSAELNITPSPQTHALITPWERGHPARN